MGADQYDQRGQAILAGNLSVEISDDLVFFVVQHVGPLHDLKDTNAGESLSVPLSGSRM